MREASRRPRVIAIETGDQTPSLSMLNVGTPPDFQCPGSQVPEIFFPRKKDSNYTQARTLCAACPVLERCRTWGDINERDIPKSGLFGMLGGETPRERYNRRIGLRPSNEKKRSVFHPGCKPCIDCGRALRPSGVKAKEMPGTLNYAAHGRCSQCLNAAVKKGLVHPKQRRETYEGKHCAGCGRALRPWSKTVEEMPGTVKHHARGMCGSCYRTELRGLEVAA